MPCPKQYYFDLEVTEKIFLGIEKLYDIIKFSYGPRKVVSTRDILLQYHVANPDENIGLSLAKNLAFKLLHQTGDGGSTSILLLYSIIKNSLSELRKGICRHKLCAALKDANQRIIDHILHNALPIKDEIKIHNLVFSATQDQALARQVSLEFSSIDIDISCLHHNNISSNFIHKPTYGLKIPYGEVSSYFLSDTKSKKISIQQPKILVFQKNIYSIQNMLLFLQEMSHTTDNILICCSNIEKDPLATLIINKIQGLLNVFLIHSLPQDTLAQIATFSHATIITKKHSFLSSDYLGYCDSAEISSGCSVLIKSNYKDLQSQNYSCTESDDLQSLEKISKSMPDIMKIIFAGIESGFVAGGGTALFYASIANNQNSSIPLSKEQQLGIQIISEACSSPLKRIVCNSGLDPNLITNKLLSLQQASIGFNVLSEEIEDLIVSGVIDSAKTIASLLTQTIETAILILSTETLIHDGAL